MSFVLKQLLVAMVMVFGVDKLKADYPPITFTCPSLPPLVRPARNVYELRPQDIKVVVTLKLRC